MTSKQIKLIAGGALLAGAVISGMGSSTPTPVAKVAKHGKGAGVGLLAITSPSDEKHYAEGTYVFEGQIGKGKKVEVLLDDRDPKNMVADADGGFRYEAQKVKAGEHKIEIKVTDPKHKDAKPETSELEFKVSESAKPEVVSHHDEKVEKTSTKVAAKGHEGEPEYPPTLLPEDDGSDVAMPGEKKLGSDDVAKKDTVTAEEAHAKKPAPKPKSSAEKPHVAKPAAPKGKFVISSHTNFNVVPHGIIKVGGKGTPGDKIMLLVDGKPSMRGTVKADGRWTFPVKVSTAGFRKITAQNLKSRQVATVKLKIK